MSNSNFWEILLNQGLVQDDAEWDWTSKAVAGKRARAKIVAKQDGVWAADGLTDAAKKISGLKIISKVKDGQAFKKGQTLQIWAGPSEKILITERPFLNLAAYAAGIATETRKVIRALGKSKTRITCTRKILPGYRDLALAALQAGGGKPHRVGLSGGVLIKENHIAIGGGLSKVVRSARDIAPHGLRVEAEVRDMKELKQAADLGCEVVMLDNFSPAQVATALRWLKSRRTKPVIEVSGGITHDNIRAYALPGVDVISMGSLTHSIRSIDLSLLVVK